jgi:hypothetical protein
MAFTDERPMRHAVSEKTPDDRDRHVVNDPTDGKNPNAENDPHHDYVSEMITEIFMKVKPDAHRSGGIDDSWHTR